MYDVLLWQKGMVAASIAALRTRVAATEDRQALSLFDKLTAARTQISNLRMPDLHDLSHWRATVVQLEQEADELEKALVRRLGTSSLGRSLAGTTWRNLQRILKKNEVALELVRFPYHNGKRWTDSTRYAALVLRPGREGPRLVDLGDADKIEAGPLCEYRKRIDPDAPCTVPAGATLHTAIWKPLETLLRNARRIYISPDGELNQVAFAVLSGSDGVPLIQKYDLRVVSSTKDLLRPVPRPAARRAVLIGNPDFDLDEAQQREAVRAVARTEGSITNPTFSGVQLRSAGSTGPWRRLDATGKEVSLVASRLKKHKWQVDAYTESCAVKPAIKQVHAPRLLHLATHGFFFPDQVATPTASPGPLSPLYENPMLRSGLVFAGANRKTRPAADPDLDDGVLTAYEATSLRLQGTELVVLSACETGLGQVHNGEGVFGLRRALQEAGADSVLMSMWSVPDQETQELMNMFYQNWLAGYDEPTALRKAQLTMRDIVRKRYGQELPQYWGAFVLVGR
jgi:CHAT domain-containing protein